MTTASTSPVPFADAIAALSDGLLAALAGERWEDADAELETLAEEVLGAILAGRGADLDALARATARCHTALRLHDAPGPEAAHRLGQLQAIGVLVNAGLRRRPAGTPDALAVPGTATAAILAALADGPRSGPQLVADTGRSVEEVAQALPALRGAGLVRSWSAGRLVMTELTEEAPRS